MTHGPGGVNPDAFRRKHNLWLAYASEIASPILKAGASLKSRGPKTPPDKWRRGLILGHTHIGDVLYRTCSLPALREFLPNCEWSYAASPASRTVLAGNPHVSEILPVISGEDSWNLVDGSFAALEQKRFDAVLCTNTLRHHPDFILAARLGIPNRVGFAGRGMSGLINHPVELPFPQSYASYFRTMVAAVARLSPDWDLRPRLYPSEDDDRHAGQVWTAFGLGSDKPVLACALRTRQSNGNWPEEVLLAIVDIIRRNTSVDIVFCGAPEDKAGLNALAESLPYDVRVLAGQFDIPGFAAFLGKCSALLTLDSGPRHIGNAMGIPVFFTRNLSHSLVEAGKYCETETDLAPPVEYLSGEETDRVARAQPVDLLAARVLERLSAR